MCIEVVERPISKNIHHNVNCNNKQLHTNNILQNIKKLYHLIKIKLKRCIKE